MSKKQNTQMYASGGAVRSSKDSEYYKDTSAGRKDPRSTKDKLMDLIPGRRIAERAQSTAKEFHGRRGVK
jgi:hypothetical protein